MKRGQIKKGFTIVELLIVIVVIAILAAITVVAYNGIQQRAATSKRESDLSTYYKAITLAREATGQTLMQITGSGYSAAHCTSYLNTANIEPRDLPKTNNCWVNFYDNLDKIGAAANMNLNSLRDGDSRGNPYVLDENEGEGGDCTRRDTMFYSNGSGNSFAVWRTLPASGFC